jgi:RNA polymerase sigma factor (sigma-70 family)
MTIAHRKAVDHHRSRTRRELPSEDIQELASEQAPPPDVGEPQLWEAVHRLPARQRSTVLLRFGGDLAHGEIAAAIGCSEEAARRSLHEGLKKLREVVGR